jgi:hypothetical protein
MKKILLLPLVALLAGGCEKAENIVFDHEQPLFELQSNAILLEVIMPQGTTADDAIYIVGEFNGGEEVAVEQVQWKLEKAAQSNHKWGIYLYPEFFEAGKTLADGFYFVSSSQGKEVMLDGQDALHTLTAQIGERVDLTVVRWESHFFPPPAWPEVPAGKILLKLTVPSNTPSNSMIAFYGNANGWDGSDYSKWGATMLDKTHYYLAVDPADFADGTSLADEFKFGLICPDQTAPGYGNWWYHQPNDDGSATEIAGFFLSATNAGMGYDLEIKAWARSADMVDLPWEPSSIITLTITVPDYTPANAVIVIRGECNSWNLSNDPKWTASMVNKTTYKLEIDPADFETGRSLADNFRPCLVIDGFGPWTFQANEDGSDASGGYFKTTTNSVEVLNWRNKDLIPIPNTGLTIKWRQPGNEWVGDMYIYAWGGSPLAEPFGAWNDTKIEADENGWYSITLPEGQTAGNVMFHSSVGGAQMDAPEIMSEDGTYEITTSTCTRLDKVVKWKQPGKEWTEMAIYAWGGTPNTDPFGAWPGTLVTDDGNGWFRVVVLYGQTVGNVIFNNNGGGAQMDAPVVDASGCYEIGTTNNDITAVSCP